MPGLIDVRGRWRRSLLAWADGRVDRTTLVDWVQGPSFYADLRSPAARPDFTGVAGLTDLTPAQVEWLGSQEGFAGRLGFDGAFFEWGRALDYQPPGPFVDAGSLRMDGRVMLEIGRDQPYLEHWERDESDLARCGALKLSAKGVEGLLVIAGEDFAYARGRAAPLPPGGTLLACLAGAGGHTEALALVDCEISIGRFDGGKLRVDRSSLPFREGRTLDPELDLAAGVLRTDDVTREGRPIKRVWRIAETEGDVADLAAPF